MPITPIMPMPPPCIVVTFHDGISLRILATPSAKSLPFAVSQAISISCGDNFLVAERRANVSSFVSGVHCAAFNLA